MNDPLLKSYATGKILALCKFAEKSGITSEEGLTALLDAVSSNSPVKVPSAEVSNDAEKVEKASWGDKIELEPSSASGIEV